LPLKADYNQMINLKDERPTSNEKNIDYRKMSV
jgi:hypothetical protein